MARTKIVIEVESENDAYVQSAGKALVLFARDFLRVTQRMAEVKPGEVTATITHDGKNVTEVIQ